MSSRKPLPLWIVVSLFVVSIVAVPLACRLLRRPSEPPRTLTELTQWLSQAEPELYLVPQHNGLEDGVWISQRPRSPEQLRGLPRHPQFANRWPGVVYCQKAITLGGEAAEVEEMELQRWGEYGRRIGPLLFFGDPALLQLIHKAILDHHGD